MGKKNRAKQDNAYLVTEMVSILYEQQGPATIVLMTGDADYAPPLEKALMMGWRTEVAFIDRGISQALEPISHEIREIRPNEIELMQF